MRDITELPIQNQQTSMTDEQDVPIGHLQPRKIEARVLIPFIEACRERKIRRPDQLLKLGLTNETWCKCVKFADDTQRTSS